jgi:two-component system sensor histidine kinase ChvG
MALARRTAPSGRQRSLRRHAFGIATGVVLLPLLAVLGTNWLEALFGDRTQDRTAAAAAEVARALGAGGPDVRSRIEALARARQVLVRVLDEGGRPELVADHWVGTGIHHRIGDLFYGADRAPAHRAWEEAAGPIAGRAEVGAARASGRDDRCHFFTPGNLYICTTTLRAAAPGGAYLVHVQASTRRALQTLYESRRQVVKLGMFALALALALAWWASARIVGPIERLREEVLARATDAVPRAGIDIGRRDELGDLADAFNAVWRALAERNRTNEAFLADLVHEFKNPVAAIRASADRLRESKPDDPARLERLADVLDGSSRRLEVLLTQLLELTRAEAGLPNESRERVDLGALVGGLASAIERDPRYAHLRVRLEPASAAPGEIEVMGVPDRLEGALRNLLDNAASFAASEVRVHVAASASEVEVRVGDDGPGITEADLPRVFERFFTTRKDRQGTGLGLSLARAVIEAHAGRVTASSPPGHGATFTATLPRAP